METLALSSLIDFIKTLSSYLQVPIVKFYSYGPVHCGKFHNRSKSQNLKHTQSIE